MHWSHIATGCDVYKLKKCSDLKVVLVSSLFATKTMRCFLSVCFPLWKCSSITLFMDIYSQTEVADIKLGKPILSTLHCGTSCRPAMAVSGYVLILLAMLMCVGCQEYSNMLQKSMKNVGTSSLQFCLNDEQKSSVSRVDPTIPLNLDDRNVSWRQYKTSTDELGGR